MCSGSVNEVGESVVFDYVCSADYEYAVVVDCVVAASLIVGLRREGVVSDVGIPS